MKSLIIDRWKELVGVGCGYFDHYELQGNEIVIWWERPFRQGGGISDRPDRFPIECFTCDTVEQAMEIIKSKNKSK